MAKKKRVKVDQYTKKTGKVIPAHSRRPPTRIPKKPARRIIITQGAGRVSDKAAEELAIEMEFHGKKVAERAVEYARDDRRQTVKDRDVKRAAKDFHTSFHREK